MKITRIRIPAEFRVDSSETRTAVADFKLGVGPCGKEVISLAIAETAGGRLLEVHQQTSDDEFKVFGYPIATLTGRYEVSYAH